MNNNQKKLKKQHIATFGRQIPFVVIPSLLVLVLTALALVWFVQFESNNFYKTQKELATSAVRGVEHSLSQIVAQRRQSVLALVDQEKELLRDIADFPVDEENLQKLELIVRNRTPDYFNYLLADGQGNPILEEKVLKIGPFCRLGIKLFSHSPGKHNDTVIIHSSESDDVHFDVMTNIDETENSVIFFVSFKADAIIELLRNTQIPDQSLLLVQIAHPGLIEVSASGVYQSQWHGRQLTEMMLRSVLAEKTVAGTGWSVLALPNSDIFAAYKNKLTLRSIYAYSGLLFIMLLFLWRLWVEERSRLSVERELYHSNEILEQRVKQRTQELSQSEKNLQKTFMSAPYGMLIIDNQGIIEAINNQSAKIFGYDNGELVGQPLEVLLPERFRQEHIKQRESYNNNQQSRLMGEGRHLVGLRKNGQEFTVEIGLSPLAHSDGKKVIASFADVSELTKLHQQLREEHERAVVTLSSIGDGVITTDIDGLIDSMNVVAERLSGWDSKQAIGKHITDVFHVIHEKTRQKVSNPVVECLMKNALVELGGDSVLIHKNGLDIPIKDSVAPIHNSDGDIIGAVLVFHDVSQSRAHAHEIEYQANHDALTGLLNRREFDSRLSNSVELARHKGYKYVLLFMDLDRFKRVNDTAGHAAGDDLLKQLTRMMAVKLRQRDTFARLGGDEFGVLLEHCSEDIGLKVANKLRSAVEDFRFYWKDQVFSVGASIGLVTFSEEAESADELLSEADAACYMAKESGRNRVQIYDAASAIKRSESSIVNMLEDAYKNNRMQLYQQQIKSTDGSQKSVHYEVLVRMLTEEGEVLSPGVFLPAAERYGLATTLDRWVTRTAFEWLAQHQSEFPVPLMLSINLSGQSITDALFKDFVRDQINEFELQDGSVCFEITETAAMNNLGNAQLFIQQLKQLGCKFSLDDFGSGHASYAHLKHLPVDYLKIDGMFVKDISQDPINFSIVKSVNEVAHVLGLKTVAEFVENDEIIEKLSEIGVDFLQGYGISRPAPLDDLLQPLELRQSAL